MSIVSYKDLIVWQKSFQLVKEIYVVTDSFPKHEIYGLTSQIRRASVSVPSNIAEGYGRKSKKEYEQFLSIAYGSVLELETQILLAIELKFISKDETEKINNLITDVSKMLYVLIRKING